MRRPAIAALFVVLANCDSSSPGTAPADSATAGDAGTSTGTVRGEGFRIVDAIAANRISGFPSTFARIDLADRPGLCEVETRYTTSRNAHTVRIDLADYVLSTRISRAPSFPGTYTATAAAGGVLFDRSAFVEVRTTDENCAYVAAHSAHAVAGTVTLTKVNNGSYAGTLDVTLDSGDRLTGSFDAPDCPGIGGITDGGTAGTCG